MHQGECQGNQGKGATTPQGCDVRENVKMTSLTKMVNLIIINKGACLWSWQGDYRPAFFCIIIYMIGFIGVLDMKDICFWALMRFESFIVCLGSIFK